MRPEELRQFQWHYRKSNPRPSDTVCSFTKYNSNLPHSRYDCYIPRIIFINSWIAIVLWIPHQNRPDFSKYKLRQNDPKFCNSFFVLINGRFKQIISWINIESYILASLIFNTITVTKCSPTHKVFSSGRAKCWAGRCCPLRAGSGDCLTSLGQQSRDPARCHSYLWCPVLTVVVRNNYGTYCVWWWIYDTVTRTQAPVMTISNTHK